MRLWWDMLNALFTHIALMFLEYAFKGFAVAFGAMMLFVLLWSLM